MAKAKAKTPEKHKPPSSHETTIAHGYPLVAVRKPRKDSLPEIGDREQQYRYLAGFEPDWFLPSELAKQWQSAHYPLYASEESIGQWVALMESVRTNYLNLLSDPVSEAREGRYQKNDLALIQKWREDLQVNARSESPAIALLDTDQAILEALAEKPELVIKITDLAVRTIPRMDRKTASNRIKYLASHSLVAQPAGKNQGWQITPTGLALYNSLQTHSP